MSLVGAADQVSVPHAIERSRLGGDARPASDSRQRPDQIVLARERALLGDYGNAMVHFEESMARMATYVK
eukprot:scaffold6434_cov202-Prasinococcus_capsulatus_cf.AAC.1